MKFFKDNFFDDYPNDLIRFNVSTDDRFVNVCHKVYLQSSNVITMCLRLPGNFSVSKNEGGFYLFIRPYFVYIILCYNMHVEGLLPANLCLVTLFSS